MLKRMRAGRKLVSLKLTIVAILLLVLGPSLAVVTASLYSASRSYDAPSTRQLLETTRTLAQSTSSGLELTAGVLKKLSRQPMGIGGVGITDGSSQPFQALWVVNGRFTQCSKLAANGVWVRILV